MGACNVFDGWYTHVVCRALSNLNWPLATDLKEPNLLLKYPYLHSESNINAPVARSWLL